MYDWLKYKCSRYGEGWPGVSDLISLCYWRGQGDFTLIGWKKCIPGTASKNLKGACSYVIHVFHVTLHGSSLMIAHGQFADGTMNYGAP